MDEMIIAANMPASIESDDDLLFAFGAFVGVGGPGAGGFGGPGGGNDFVGDPDGDLLGTFVGADDL